MAESEKRVRIRLQDGSTGTFQPGNSSSFVPDKSGAPSQVANPFKVMDRAAAYGTIGARPSFAERMLPMAGQIIGGIGGAAAGSAALPGAGTVIGAGVG